MSLYEPDSEAAPASAWYFASARELIAAEPGRRVDREAELDLALLAWAARFAFVTSSTLACRWGVSEQKMRKRVRRLARDGFVRRVQAGRNQPARIVVTERGGSACGLELRVARGEEPLGHELAIIKRVMAIERYFASHGAVEARVVTERDMRRDKRQDGQRKWAVEVVEPHGRRAKRWADYAVETREGRTAVELEFSLKATSRLRAIVRGYAHAAHYDFVDFVVPQRPRDAQLWRTLTRLVDEQLTLRRASALRGFEDVLPKIRVVPWRDPLPWVHAGIAPFPPVERPAS